MTTAEEAQKDQMQAKESSVDNSKVICPGCAHQFHAVPVAVQHELRMLTEGGVIECMVRNKAVSEYIGDLEQRIAALARDAARLDKLQSLTRGYGYGWVLRDSSEGRGMRLHETSRDDAKPTVRAAIDALKEKP